jgi:hypothetical protein
MGDPFLAPLLSDMLHYKKNGKRQGGDPEQSASMRALLTAEEP